MKEKNLKPFFMGKISKEYIFCVFFENFEKNIFAWWEEININTTLFKLRMFFWMQWNFLSLKGKVWKNIKFWDNRKNLNFTFFFRWYCPFWNRVPFGRSAIRVFWKKVNHIEKWTRKKKLSLNFILFFYFAYFFTCFFNTCNINFLNI